MEYPTLRCNVATVVIMTTQTKTLVVGTELEGGSSKHSLTFSRQYCNICRSSVVAFSVDAEIRERPDQKMSRRMTMERK